MKRCPKCGQTYTDQSINFCLNDGELLSYLADDAPQTLWQNASPGSADDPPRTEFMPSPRVTSETNWPAVPAPVPYQSPQFPVPQFGQYATMSPNQTLAIVSLGLGAASLTIGWCCYLGLLLSPAALITGIIALVQIKKDPQAYGGRGFALAGIITAALFLAGFVLIILIYGIGLFLGGLK